MNEPEQESADKPKKVSAGKVPSESFLWHFAPTIHADLVSKQPFSHEHWWGKTPEDVPLDAAMWELFRRHPQIPRLLARIDQRFINPTPAALLGVGKFMLDNLECALARMCCLTWKELEKTDLLIWGHVMAAKVKGQSGFYPQPVHVLNYSRLSPTKPSHPENDLQTRVVELDRNGMLLLAIDPFAPRLGKRVEEVAAQWRHGLKPRKVGKASVGQWLKVIATFESAERTRKKTVNRDDQLFARYRRVIARWEWPG